jgi:hypothetical protein
VSNLVTRTLRLALLTALGCCLFPIASLAAPMSSGQLLERYITDWTSQKKLALPRPLVANFAIAGADGGEFHGSFGTDGSARLAAGLSRSCDFEFTTDFPTLRRRVAGELNALTAMAFASETDDPPLRRSLCSGIGAEQAPLLSLFATSFWTLGSPQVVGFSKATSRNLQGALATLLHYNPDVAVVWYRLENGMRLFADPREQKRSTSAVVALVRGSLKARIGGSTLDLAAGQSVFIPPMTETELWVTGAQEAELLFVSFP